MNKSKIGGILEIISGVLGLVYVATYLIILTLRGFLGVGEPLDWEPYLYAIGFGFLFVFFVISILALIGGLCAIKNKRWGLALAGAIGSLILLFFCGIPALIFIIQARSEFNNNVVIAELH